jgi:hypothetical protein
LLFAKDRSSHVVRTVSPRCAGKRLLVHKISFFFSVVGTGRELCVPFNETFCRSATSLKEIGKSYVSVAAFIPCHEHCDGGKRTTTEVRELRVTLC